MTGVGLEPVGLRHRFDDKRSGGSAGIFEIQEMLAKVSYVDDCEMQMVKLG